MYDEEYVVNIHLCHKCKDTYFVILKHIKEYFELKKWKE